MRKALVSSSTAKGKESCWAVVVHALSPSTWESGRQISVSLVYKATSKIAKAVTERNLRERENKLNEMSQKTFIWKINI